MKVNHCNSGVGKTSLTCQVSEKEENRRSIGHTSMHNKNSKLQKLNQRYKSVESFKKKKSMHKSLNKDLIDHLDRDERGRKEDNSYVRYHK